MRLFTPSVVVAVLLGVVALSLAAPQAQDAEYEYDESGEEAPPPPPSSTPRGTVSRGRGVAARKPTAPKKATETAPPPPPPSAETSSEEETAVDATAATTTEAPKKYLIAGRNGVVRPFRSHEELLAALKRRRQSNPLTVSTHAPVLHEESSTASPARQSKRLPTNGNLNSNNKRRTGNIRNTEAVAQEADEKPVAPVSSLPRRGPPSFRRPQPGRTVAATAVVAAEDAEESQHQEESTPARTSRFNPSSRRRQS